LVPGLGSDDVPALNDDGAESRRVSVSEESNPNAEISGSSTDVVWTERDAIWASTIESPQKRMIAKGDCPRISPDGKLFYYRNAAHQAVICQWPSMAGSTTLLSGKQVGQLAVWSPSSNVILLDRTRLFIGLFAVSVPEAREYSLGYIQSWGVVASSVWWVDWGDLGPAQLRSFKDKPVNDGG
jgi:hypothetical protein